MRRLIKAVLLDTAHKRVYLGHIWGEGDAAENIDQWCDELGINSSDCEWMAGDNLTVQW